ncbi:MAG: UTP--glucose-1-phosphate uridylyltransferase [Halobacteriovoraceae bacterium]|nr:UTP--glucose-1-phosphate uridylyltransferase [Halobacteriovoraceae bacterium]
MKIKKAIIPVAGKGTRFLPVTKSIPKEMIPILDTPMIHYVVNEAIESGIEEIIFVVSEEKESLLNYFSTNAKLEKFLEEKKKFELLKKIHKISNSARFVSVEQKEQLGLGHAVLQAEDLIDDNEPFAVILGDDLIFGETPTTKQLMDISESLGRAPVIGVMEVPREDVKKYGIVKGTPVEGSATTFKMEAMVEKPSPQDAPSNLATPGRYILNKQIFELLKSIPRGSGGEYQLTDAINEMAKQRNVYAHIFDGRRIDTGQPLGYLEATVRAALDNSKLRESFISIIRKEFKKDEINL